jgi:serine/threonine-protein kinase
MSDGEYLSPGTIFHVRYEVVRLMRAGGMGAVYEVTDRETARRRALKTMLGRFASDADMRARFRLEATVGARIESEHVVEVFDAGVDQATGQPFIVMELLRGESLADAVANLGPMERDHVVLLLQQAALALDRTHAAGVVHRDLKPENLFLTTRDDGTVRLKILDFGIAKVIAETTGAGTTRSLGTPLYMCPEQIRGDGDIGHRADLYALGHLAYTMLTGHSYWEDEARRSGSSYGFLMTVMAGGTEPASGRAVKLGVELPPRFDDWFAKATAHEPSQRFGTASELVAALAAALDAAAPVPTQEPVASPPRSRDLREPRRWRVAWVTAGLALVAAAGGLWANRAARGPGNLAATAEASPSTQGAATAAAGVDSGLDAGAPLALATADPDASAAADAGGEPIARPGTGAIPHPHSRAPAPAKTSGAERPPARPSAGPPVTTPPAGSGARPGTAYDPTDVR